MKIRRKSKILRNLSRTISGITHHGHAPAPDENEEQRDGPLSPPPPAPKKKAARGRRRGGLLRTLSTTIAGLAPLRPQPAPEPVREEPPENPENDEDTRVLEAREDTPEYDTRAVSAPERETASPAAPRQALEETGEGLLTDLPVSCEPERAQPQSCDLPVGAVIGGQYRVIKILGKGGMGVVYEAFQSSLDRYVALKVLPVDLMTPEYLERFRIEAAAAARLEHPNIVPIYTIGESDGLHYFVMGYVKGRTLEDIIDERSASPVKNRRFLPEGEVIDIVLQVASALDFAHANGVVHGDIKPANIMIDSAGKCVVTDFGLAAVTSYHTRAQDGVLGSPLYMPPERARGETGDNRCDIYSLGAVLYEMLTGNCAFDSESVDAVLRDVVAGRIVPPAVRRPSLSPVVEAIVLKAMSLHPRDRYQTMDSFVGDLHRYQSGQSISVPMIPASAGVPLGPDKGHHSSSGSQSSSSRGKARGAAARQKTPFTVGRLLFWLCFIGALGAAMYLHYTSTGLREQIQMRTERDIAYRFTVADTFRSLHAFKLARKMYSDIAEEYPDAGLHDRVLENVKLLNQEQMNNEKSGQLSGDDTPKSAVGASSAPARKTDDMEEARLKRILDSARRQATDYRRRNLPERADAVFVGLMHRYPGTEVAKIAKETVERESDRVFSSAFEKVSRFISSGNYEQARKVYEKIIIDYDGTDIAAQANRSLYDLVEQQISVLEMENYNLKQKARR